MTPRITPEAQADIDFWKQNDPKVKQKIDTFVRDALEHPFQGLGKPEALKHHKPLWSRRITKEHRLVYYIKDDSLIIVSCRYHYVNL
ncbi:Txe/YoeB family addiction module toxin [Kosakonia cowanii]|uniref:Txe/YoeB family addiction module toxin n=1 Tax=Kosakonia cowanii TaxID=208223 RepID=UPI003F6A14EE